jgi:dihydroorotate dehydrogenase
MITARYDITRTYDWNYDHAPERPPEVDVPECPGEWDFCGIPVNSPLGMPAGPLLNSRWLLYYAALGFDVLTYKTVRSRYRACYGLPNLLPIEAPQFDDATECVRVAAGGAPSWAISFGMPSKEPLDWQEDVQRARRGMRPGQVLVVSVVASPQAGWTMDDTVSDYVALARMARDAGAQAIEANISCPNVCTAEGEVFLSQEASRAVASEMRAAVPELPLILKIGKFPTPEQARAHIEAVNGYADALSTVNSLTARVRGAGGEWLFDGLKRGIGGECVRERANAEAVRLRDIVERTGARLKLIGVGGVFTAADVRERLAAGAHNVQLATAAMLDPQVALRIRREGLS